MKNFKHSKHFDFSNIPIYKENLTKCLFLTDKTGYRDADASKNKCYLYRTVNAFKACF